MITSVALATIMLALVALAAATVIRGWRGGLSVYIGGLLLALSVWPGLVLFAALRFGWGSEPWAYAADKGRYAAFSVAVVWVVCGLVVAALSALVGWLARFGRTRLAEAQKPRA